LQHGLPGGVADIIPMKRELKVAYCASPVATVRDNIGGFIDGTYVALSW
jgi:hypothetical protein